MFYEKDKIKSMEKYNLGKILDSYTINSPVEISKEIYQAKLYNYLEILKPDFITVFNLRSTEPILFSENYNIEFKEGSDESIYEILNCIDEDQIDMIKTTDEIMLEFIMNNFSELKHTTFKLNFTASLIEGKPKSFVRDMSFINLDVNQKEYITFNSIKDVSNLHGLSKMPKIDISSSNNENIEFIKKLNLLRQELNVVFQNHLNLTPREQEILNLIAIGKTSQEIANILFISLFTVNTHRQNLLRKHNLKNIIPLIKLV